MSIFSNIQAIRENILPNVRMVCVSKFHPNEAIQEAYEIGERIFGESKVQDLCKKRKELAGDISWHFIGHLQTNKVKDIVPFVELIHGVDSFKLLTEINMQGSKIERKINCLLQVHIAQEETKFGFDEQELYEMLNNGQWKGYKHIVICGLMGMATFTDNTGQIRLEFRKLKRIFDKVKKDFFAGDCSFTELSMGMSDDYQIAMEEGSTLVRIGTTIFGQREY